MKKNERKEVKRTGGREMKKNETRTRKEQIEDIIEVKRCDGLYVIIDKKKNIILAKLVIDEKANDFINSRLRDSIVRIYYQYGKIGYSK